MVEERWTPLADAILLAGKRVGRSAQLTANRLSFKTGQRFTRNMVIGRWRRRAHPLFRKDAALLAAEVAAQVEVLQGTGLSWREIARRVGHSREWARALVDADYKRRCCEKRERLQARIASGQHAPQKRGRPWVVAIEATEPRNPIYDPHRDGPLYHDSLSSMLMGDPPVGRAEIMRRAS